MREGDEQGCGRGHPLRVNRIKVFEAGVAVERLPSWIPIHVCMALIVSLLCMGCRTSVERRQYEFDPMPGIWAETVAGIDDLQLRGATIPEWRASAADSEVIGSIGELKEVLASVPLADGEWIGLVADFNAAAKVLHFGFEGNFHALVYFDQNGRAYRTLKW